MSWSVNGVGRASAVAEKLNAQLDAIRCAEPEETVKRKVSDILAVALSAFPPNVAVKVAASGSQHRPDDKKTNEVINSVSLTIEPLYGFIE